MDRLLPPAPVSEALRLENLELHRRGYFNGDSLRPHLQTIAGLCKRHRVVSLLDFGSGKGEAWAMRERPDVLRDVHLTLYDPAVPGLHQLPDEVFDAVLCVDVLEHIPEDDLPGTLQAIAARARKFVYLVVCCRPGTKLLPFSMVDVHVTVRREDWWRRLVAAHMHDLDVHLLFSK